MVLNPALRWVRICFSLDRSGIGNLLGRDTANPGQIPTQGAGETVN